MYEPDTMYQIWRSRLTNYIVNATKKHVSHACGYTSYGVDAIQQTNNVSPVTINTLLTTCTVTHHENPEPFICT
ncbi:hypothetical protein BS47DRAFT_1348857 [Hydnum rufescens UP504]|uniref:Uncharacterized protein n=1 Tax=Hydnum rufescens UP504 TaxID=1448309 RepID=A0A9P6DSL7_9AGAM|nr:hypothetical protein BS47DRAFT_1348857 [Hydnum rufescens UP504]